MPPNTGIVHQVNLEHLGRVVFERDQDGWSFEARAGAGLVADSDPVTERQETEAKISAILAALAAPA